MPAGGGSGWIVAEISLEQLWRTIDEIHVGDSGFGVLLADWLRAGARYTRSSIFDAPAWRPELLLAWILGFALYHWLHEPPLGPSWWVDVVEETGQPNLGIGASLPSFAASFVLALGLSTLGSRLPQPVSKW